MKNRALQYWLLAGLITLLLPCRPATTVAMVTNELAIATIARPILENDHTYEFTLTITRTTDEWLRWANGTFQLAVTGGGSYDNLGIELIKDSTDLNLSSYTITPRIITKTTLTGNKITAERASITVLGPKLYTDAFEVKLDTTKPLRVGRFKIYTIDGKPFPAKVTLTWLQPEAYFQTTAYKLQNDSIPWHEGDNNIEMRNRTLYFVEPASRIPTMQIVLCDSTYYEGQRVCRIQWSTTSERNSYGYTLWRALLPYGSTDINSLKYEQIAAFPGIGQGNSNSPHLYPPYFDSVDVLRGERYFYKVISMSSDNTVNVDSSGVPIEGICSVTVPYSVIVKAAARQNPFSEGTAVDYKLDDDVYLTIKVYDPIGKLVTVLMDNKLMKIGHHEVTFEASQFAIQGMYNIVFVASPIKDESVELSKAVVKLELMR
ncbi:MAG: hypothetical protein U0264_14590 [Candidatus Kapaibacterium sp.]